MNDEIKIGRPCREFEKASLHMHLRITPSRKDWYARYATLHNLTVAELIQSEMDVITGYTQVKTSEVY